MKPSSSSCHQRGFAAVLMMLLTGVAVTGAVLGTASSLRGTQEQQLAVHAQTRAQLRAWTGVEALRTWFGELSAQELENLAQSTKPAAISLVGLDGVQASLTGPVAGTEPDENGRHRFTVLVSGSGAGSHSTVEVVIEAGGADDPPVTGGNHSTGGINAVTIRRDLRLTGHINITGNLASNITVEGDVTMSGTVTGVERICTVKDENGNGGDLTINSAINVANVCADGTLTLTGGASADTVEATGDVLLSGGAASSIGSILSNQNVRLTGGSASAQIIRAHGDVQVSGGNATAGSIETLGNVSWTSTNSAPTTIRSSGNVTYSGNNASTSIEAGGNVSLTGGGNAGTVKTKGNTTITSYWGQGIQTRLDGEGNLTCNNGNVVAAGRIGGTKSCNDAANVQQSAGYQVNLAPIDVPEYIPESVPPILIDVYPLRATANYVFEVDSANRRMVTVHDVHDIPDGTYYLVSYGWMNNRGNEDFLCRTLKPNGKCDDPATPWKTICEGYSTSNSCFGYNNGTWTLAGKSMAPGLAWFDGNLNLSNGVYFNTFLATGNITTGGSMKTYSVNYAGKNVVCNNDRSEFGLTGPADFNGLYPLTSCQNGQFQPAQIGNTALVAGGYLNGTFRGGDISLGASNNIFGSVLAGNTLKTSGSTSVTGQIVVAAQSPTATETVWSGSTTVHMSTEREDFDPTDNPFEEDEEADTGTGEAPEGSLVRVLWTRYR